MHELNHPYETSANPNIWLKKSKTWFKKSKDLILTNPSACSTVSMLAMNVLMSGTSLVAPELSLNQSHLAELTAKELVGEQEIKVNDVQPDL